MRKFLLALLVMLAAAIAADLPMIQPKELAATLTKDGPKPIVIQVGPNVMYRSKHIPGAIYAGPGQKQEGLDMLKAAVAKYPKDREIVLYCGCCPWDRCPNVAPAMTLLKDLGYTKVKAMYVKENFKTDWTDQGFPGEQ
jgi:thiosulfate/3-mercaptopyruvate sulfurtransferase